VTHSCYSCQWHLCVQCVATWTGCSSNVNVNVNSNVEIKKEVKEEVVPQKDSGFPCNQCGGGIKFGKTGNRINDAVCFKCKKNGHQFTFFCKNCDLDVCEPCAEKIKDEALQMLGNFMEKGGNMMGGMGGNMGGNQGNNRQQGGNNQQQGGKQGGMGGMMGKMGGFGGGFNNF